MSVVTINIAEWNPLDSYQLVRTGRCCIDKPPTRCSDELVDHRNAMDVDGAGQTVGNLGVSIMSNDDEYDDVSNIYVNIVQ